jgi:hypothetical protein
LIPCGVEGDTASAHAAQPENALFAISICRFLTPSTRPVLRAEQSYRFTSA